MSDNQRNNQSLPKFLERLQEIPEVSRRLHIVTHNAQQARNHPLNDEIAAMVQQQQLEQQRLAESTSKLSGLAVNSNVTAFPTQPAPESTIETGNQRLAA